MSGEQPNDRLPQSDDLTNVDLYCLHCGYNLRGLSGDPRRCPECGELNPMTPSVDMIARQLREMEIWPTACVAATVFLIISETLIVLVLTSLRPSVECYLCCLSPLLFSLSIWFAGMEQFRADCMHHPDWKVVLARYHLYGLALSVLVASAVGVLFWSLQVLLGADHTFAGLASLLVLVAAGVAVLPLIRRIRRRCTAKMNTLQRDVAVTRAKVRLHERLSRPRS